MSKSSENAYLANIQRPMNMFYDTVSRVKIFVEGRGELPQVITLREAIEGKSSPGQLRTMSATYLLFFLIASLIMLSVNILVIPEDAIQYHSLLFEFNADYKLAL